MYGTSGDVFSEVLVKKNLSVGDKIVRGLCALVALAIVALFLLGFFTVLPGLFIIAIIILVALYFVIKFQKVEYEYVFTSGEIDFDKLSGDFRRKRKLTVNFDQMDVMAPEKSHELDQYQHGEFKTYDFSSGDKTKERFVYVGRAKDQRVKVIFEPNEKMVNNMYMYSPRKVKKD